MAISSALLPISFNFYYLQRRSTYNIFTFLEIRRQPNHWLPLFVVKLSLDLPALCYTQTQVNFY
ncbi:hypothetical protein SAMN05428962_2719 [Paenibacillus sp. BC26]|nr:hypothetical protein SAMN05428962_2719 [Paenibacillus sp. BC26]